MVATNVTALKINGKFWVWKIEHHLAVLSFFSGQNLIPSCKHSFLCFTCSLFSSFSHKKRCTTKICSEQTLNSMDKNMDFGDVGINLNTDITNALIVQNKSMALTPKKQIKFSYSGLNSSRRWSFKKLNTDLMYFWDDPINSVWKSKEFRKNPIAFSLSNRLVSRLKYLKKVLMYSASCSSVTNNFYRIQLLLGWIYTELF